MTAASDSGTTTNLMQAGDALALTFSEALAPGSVPASRTSPSRAPPAPGP